MKRPAFQFYPGDWGSNANLRRCSHSERGIWVDVLCLMHDSEEYGVLRWPLKDIAQAVGCKPQELKSLAAKGVLKGADSGVCASFVYIPRHAGKDGEPVTLVPEQEGPVWYSSRMVKDEYLRQKRGEGTRFEAPDTTPKPAPNPTIGDESGASKGDGASSSSSTPTSKPKNKKTSADAPFVLPDWIPVEPWQAYLEMRNKKRKPATDYAKKLVVAELEKLRAAGNEPGAVLDRSTKAGWTDVYAVPAGASVSGKTLEQLIAEDPTYASE